MASTKLQKTFSSAGNRKTFTFSVWIKRASVASQAVILDSNYSGGANEHRLFIDNDDILEYYDYSGSAYQFRYKTNRKLRDVNGWYHIVCSVDTTQGTAGDRVKIYINGVRETSFSTSQNPSQNHDCILNNDQLHQIGTKNTGAAFFDGSMSHINFVDGTAYQASTFGSTDSTTGEWQITTSPSVTYGTNGFFILKDGNSVTDQSGNSNNFTVAAGTLTQTADCPSNVFATFNPLIGLHSNGSTLVPNLDAGNTDAWYNSTAWRIAQSTLAASSGKYYAEFKQSNDYGTDYTYIGIYDLDSYAQKISGYPYIADMANCFSIKNGNGNVYTNASDQGSYGTSYGNGDIIGVAMDLDNNKIYWSKNGTWMNSANPSNGTGGYSITADKTYAFGIQLYNNAWRGNFGNGYFGTTAVASAGTNASGNGIFEYDTPTGFTALSTKGLNL